MIFLFNWFVKITGWLPYKLLVRPKTYHEDRSVQSRKIKGNAIVVSNHNALLDFAVTMFTFPTRTLRCAVAEVMFKKNFLMTLFLKLMGTVRVDRDIHDFSFLGKCKSILSKGGVVEIYPESRLPNPGEERPLEFKTSAVYLALESGAKIIPIYNNAKYFTKDPMRIMIGKPIDVRELYRDDLSEKDNIENINAYVRGKIIEYGNQIRLIDEGNEKQ